MGTEAAIGGVTYIRGSFVGIPENSCFRLVILIKLFLSLSSPPVFEFRNCVSPETTAHCRISSGQHEY